MSKLIEKCFSNKHNNSAYQAKRNLREDFNLPNNVSQEELLTKLSSMGLITYTICYDKILIYLTDNGKLYVETTHQKRIKMFWHVIIHIITFALSTASLIVAICK